MLEPHFDIDIRYTSTLLPILFHIPGSRASDIVEHPVYKFAENKSSKRKITRGCRYY